MVLNVLDYLERSAEQFPEKIAFFGVVYSGNFYVPLDLKQPAARMEAMLNVADPKIIIVPDKEDISFQSENRIIISREDLKSADIDDTALAKIRKEHLDINPLYLMFTSGSTGIPKGVLVGHRSVIDLAEQFTDVFHFDENEVFANQAPFDFDVSVKDIYCTLRNGASMYIMPQSMFSMPKKLVACLKEKKITTCIWAVSALSILASMKIWDQGISKYLKKILFSGEVMPIKVLNYWREHLPDVMYVNLYGPTEITCNCTYHILDREFGLQETIPIGKAFDNTQILLLDSSGKEVPNGEMGEICVKGSCLALGYYNNREATEKSFSQDLQNSMFPDKIYHTGDYGSYNDEGQLVFSARKDWQIKHMGHRIELSEIENAGNGISWVDACCCQYDKNRGKIIMAYQSKESCNSELMKELQKMLPKYMCPNRLVWMPRIPRNQRGKIDRTFLKKKYAGEQEKKSRNYLYQDAVILGTGSLALLCADTLREYNVHCRIYDTAEKKSITLERQAKHKNIAYQWIPGEDLADCLSEISTPTLLVSAINPWIIPNKVIENPYLEAVNCHQALLPKHAGRNAEMWAIYDEDEKTGITWHRINSQIDGGEILIQKELLISRNATSFGIFRQQIRLAHTAFCEILEELLRGTAKGQAQPVEKPVMHYSWETPENGRLDTDWPFHKISAFLRALDYGGLNVVKKPYLAKNNQKIFWKSYQIKEETQNKEAVCFEENHICILRPEGRIILKETY